MDTRSTVRQAVTEAAIRRCFPVVAELRPHLREPDFLDQVRRQQADGYRLVFLASGRQIHTVAGYRVTETLMWGRVLYVDDLVSASGVRSRGWGRQMFNWLVAEARRESCGELHLDSGVQRFAAHRFYLAQRMEITCHHFALKLA